MDTAIFWVVGIGLAALLGLIPANIAKSKGRSFGLWWFYGWMLFLVALIHAVSLPYDHEVLDRQAVVAGTRRKCPACAEYVKSDARVCRFCGFDLSAAIEAEALARQESERVLAEERRRRSVIDAESAATAAGKRTENAAKTKKVLLVAIPVAIVLVVVIALFAQRQQAVASNRAKSVALEARYQEALVDYRSANYKFAIDKLESLPTDYKDVPELLGKARTDLQTTRDFIVNREGAMTSYLGAGGDIVVPATVGGVRVVAIEDSAFRERNPLRSVAIPEGVTRIGPDAFKDCAVLETVVLPKSLTLIDYRAFEDCSSLTNLTIPKSVSSIGPKAFAGCAKLRIRVPKTTSVKDRVDLGYGYSVEGDAFEGCSKVEYY